MLCCVPSNKVSVKNVVISAAVVVKKEMLIAASVGLRLQIPVTAAGTQILMLA